jgi:hypothetical protein
MLLSPEIILTVGALVVLTAGAMPSVPQVVRHAGAGRGLRTCANGNRGSPGTWEILSSPRKHSRTGVPGNNPRPAAVARSGGGSETCVIPWYRQAKETKRGGRGGRKSQCLDSTDEAGELDPRGPGGGEARHRVTRLSSGNTRRASNLDAVSPPRRRIVQYGFDTALARSWTK